MISAVILVFAFVTTAFTHPLTTQGQTTTGIEQTAGEYVKNTIQSAESVIPNTPQGEKTEYQGIQNVYNQQQQQQQAQQVEPVGQKTGAQSSPETYPHGVNTPVDTVGFQTRQEVYTQEKTSGAYPVRPVSTYVEQVGGEVEKRPESSVTPVATNVEKTETHGTHTQYSSEQQPVLLSVNPDASPKQVVPVNVAVPAEPQQIVPVPITPGIQPLSVLPVPGSQIVNPIVVPTEGVTGRLIIMSIEPIQQRVFQPETPNTVGSVEKQVPQQVSQPVDYTPVQGQVEPSNQQYLSAQNYVPENVEKQVPQQQSQAVNEAFNTVQQQVAEQTQQQLYNVQPNPQANVAPVANNVEKQIPYNQETQPSHYVPNQPQEVEPSQQQQPLNVQQVVPQQPQVKTEHQLPYQQSQVENTAYIPNIPYPAQKIQPAPQGVATHVPDHVSQNENPKQSLPNQPAQSVQQPLQTFSCIPAQTLSAVPSNPQVPYVKPVSSTSN